MKIEIKHGSWNPFFLFLECPHYKFLVFVFLVSFFCLTFSLLFLCDANYWARQNNDNTNSQVAASITIATHAPKTLWIANPGSKTPFSTREFFGL
jgi:hypothetical protein